MLLYAQSIYNGLLTVDLACLRYASMLSIWMHTTEKSIHLCFESVKTAIDTGLEISQLRAAKLASG